MRTKRILFFLIGLLSLACSTSEDSPNVTVNSNPTTENGSDSNDNPSNFGEGDQAGSNDEAESDVLAGLFSRFQSFMSNRGISGGQLAITLNEKLVFYRSSGFADTQNAIEVNEESLFRIASISKPITLLAISKLVAENRLNMNDRVFGTGRILGTAYGTAPYESAVERITVRNLVDHKSGFTNDPYDIMFDDISLSHADLISKVLDERSLTFSPGAPYYYSNFGYCLLGRIIEEVTGQTYEDYVIQEILAPMGISKMKVGGNTLEEQFNNEVTYYSSWFNPYEMNVTRMDSHGGWIASAKDLARFAVYTDTRGSMELLDFGDGQSYLEFGSYAHFGALPGTMSVLSVGPAFSYAAVFNAGNANFEVIQNAFVEFMNNEIQSQQEWPNEDLF